MHYHNTHSITLHLSLTPTPSAHKFLDPPDTFWHEITVEGSKEKIVKKMPRTQRHNNEHGRYVHASGAWWECGASCDPVHRDLDN